MPTYTYQCDECGHHYDTIKSISNREEPTKEPCSNCGGGPVRIVIGAPKLVTGVKSTLRQAGTGWGEVLKKVKSGSGRENNIND